MIVLPQPSLGAGIISMPTCLAFPMISTRENACTFKTYIAYSKPESDP
jgi:hypothetical protein